MSNTMLLLYMYMVLRSDWLCPHACMPACICWLLQARKGGLLSKVSSAIAGRGITGNSLPTIKANMTVLRQHDDCRHVGMHAGVALHC